MTATCSAAAAYAQGLIEVAAKAGIPRADLLARAGLPERALAAPTNRIPMVQLIALFEAAAGLGGRPDIGLEFGRRVQPGTYSALGYALMTCRTLGDAIALVPHYRRLVFDYGYSETGVRIDGDGVELAWVLVPSPLPYCVSLSESVIAGWFTFGRWMSNADLVPDRVHFRHESPADPSAHEAYFGCPVRFDQSENALYFPRRYLDLPLSQADRSINLAMREQARAMVDRVFGQSEIQHQLRKALTRLMPQGAATLERAAGAMGLSSRTLQRRLDQAGLSFKSALDGLRRELALVYLQDANLSLVEIAMLLGFAEHSSFTRAFRDWMGETPTEHRHRSAVAE
ncbi:MAG: AraC family transcriptional regulator [Gammaproteobacteria bacterium]|nr:AraC family transcriptional regulator [Gammaproteobacteria bacterium]